MTDRVVLASGNRGKIREIDALLRPLGWRIVPQDELGVSGAEETGLTFVENAILKARHACQQTGLAAIADDSGLEVDALNGAPGIHSARYAGAHGDDAGNRAKLLQALLGVADPDRTARFLCVIVFMSHAADPSPVICEGAWEGRIAASEHGDGGFGYDPVFIPTDANRTAAQMEAAAKNAVSHRALALQQLKDRLL